MAGIMKKIEQVLHPDKTHAASGLDVGQDGSLTTGTTGYGNTTTDTSHHATGHHGTSHHASGTIGIPGTNPNHGPHSSVTANKLDPRVDSTTVGGYGTTGTTAGYGGTRTGLTGGSTNAGPHNSNLANKLDPRVDSDLDGSTRVGETGAGYGTQNSTGHATGYNTTGTGVTGGSTNTGPHNSNLLNKIDPRVDSDHDGSTRVGATSAGYGTQRSTGHATGYNTTGTGVTEGSTNTGPHNSNLLNQIDPRVDSDRDGSTRVGATGEGYGTQHSTGHATGYNTTGTGVTGGSTNTGPHNSNLLNKIDPRVDSDLDGSTTTGSTGAGYGTHHSTGLTTGSSGTGTGLTGGSTNAGPHNSNVANKIDPRVDSDLDGSSGTNTHGSTKRTAGPHKSDLLNKLDPRVDSNLDGSRTIGG